MKSNRPIILALVFASMTASAPVAHAQLNLAWNNCITQATAAADKAYACDGSANGIAFRAVLSFVSPANLDFFVGMQAVVDVRASTLPTLPDWWKLGLGECRDGNFSFPVSLTGVGTGTSGVCRNPWAGGGTGGGFLWLSENKGDTEPPTLSPGWGRVKLALARDTEASLIQGQQYVAGMFTLDSFNDVDTGGGTCAGCALPACLVFNQVELLQVAGSPGGDIVVLNTPATRAFITWQGGAIGGNGCPIEVPVRNATWGSIKAIYR
jgi:hypothetical protein